MALTNTRIEFLKKREQEIHAQLAAERAKSQRREDKETNQAAKLVGKAAMEMAAQDAAFGATLKRVLETRFSNEKRALDLLRRKGLI